MSEKDKAAKSEIQILRDAFEGMKGRQPKSDQELKEWLATDEGNEATLFKSTSFSRLAKLGTLNYRFFCRSNGRFIYRSLPMSALGSIAP